MYTVFATKHQQSVTHTQKLLDHEQQLVEKFSVASRQQQESVNESYHILFRSRDSWWGILLLLPEVLRHSGIEGKILASAL